MMAQLVKKLSTVKRSVLAETPSEQHSSTNFVLAARNTTPEDPQRAGPGQKQPSLLKKFPSVGFPVLTILPSLHCRDTKFEQMIESRNESGYEKPEFLARKLLAHRDGEVMTAFYHQLEPIFEFVYGKRLEDFVGSTELDEIADWVKD